MNWKLSVSKNEFMPEKDVIRKTEDGRDIVIARKGTPMPMDKARKLGLLPEEKEPAKKSANASENKKADSGAENKSAKGKEEK